MRPAEGGERTGGERTGADWTGGERTRGAAAPGDAWKGGTAPATEGGECRAEPRTPRRARFGPGICDGNDRTMTVVRINAITVREGSGDELARRFAARPGAVDGADGFEGFELLRPTDDRDVWLVVTRWRDEDAFQAWVRSPAFAHGHRGDTGPSGDRGVGRDGGSAPEGQPVGVHSELWSYDVIELPPPG